MFADRVRIFIKSGKGGDGHVSFRRELYVPAGGPDGGNGGHGGDIIFMVDKGLNTLGDFRHNSKYIAESGEEGGKRRCTGKDGEDLIIKVPEGTVIYDDESGKVIADMSGDNLQETILKGGRGGKGNMNYATSTMQAPQYAQPGQDAQELWVRLELKVIADVGLVRLPIIILQHLILILVLLILMVVKVSLLLIFLVLLRVHQKVLVLDTSSYVILRELKSLFILLMQLQLKAVIL